MSRNHAYCKVGIAPLRADHQDASEQVSQLLFGEVVELLEVQGSWTKVSSMHDGYTGWVDSKQIETLREKEVGRWLDGLQVEHSSMRWIEGPEGRFWISKGCFRPDDSASEFNIGKSVYTFLDDPEQLPENKLQFATSYLNVPYLWGGKSFAGIDCSGLVQQVHRFEHFQLPRDAYQQEEIGVSVPWEEREAGDLAFFVNDSGRVHHVGILMNREELIHAHGYVRVDHLSAEGITRKLDGVLSHRLHSIKRLH